MLKLICAGIFLWASISIGSDVYVQGYTKSNGTYVQPYHRTSPDNTLLNNYSTKGNINPYTGKAGTIDPYKQYEQPTFRQKTFEQPTYQQPTFQQPTYQRPAYQQNAYQYQQPTYKQPSYKNPYEIPTSNGEPESE